MNEILPTKYLLQSVKTGRQFEDRGWTLDAPGESTPTLIRAIYENKQLHLKDDSFGLYKFAEWLPVRKMLKGSSAPVTYKSKGLAAKLGLDELWITFSGYYPEKSVFMRTCSFKETEAYSVCARMDEQLHKILVVASAGNTARSFARVCSDNDIPLLLCVPEDNLNALWFDEPIKDVVKLVVTRSGSDYFDAIHLSNQVCTLDNFIAEGGAKNVARRDGMGTTALSAITTIGRIPDYYFQAVGSGTGAVAAWEANLRLVDDGRYGENKMKLLVSQNKPFIPIYEAWKSRSRQILPMDDVEARRQVEIIDAKVLSNRKPPYAIAGGLFDALLDTDGDVLIASNEEAREAARLFLQTEGVDLHPASAIATATLMQAVKEGRVKTTDLIMLNITGGGEERFKNEHTLHFLKPSHIFDIDPPMEEIMRQMKKLFG